MKKPLKILGIDCIFEGEGENVVGKIFKAAIEGQEIPRHIETEVGETPTLEEIPDIVNPSINGLVELGRGCCRGCQFCNVTLRPLRWYPLEKINREMNVNMDSGNTGVCLHSEDVMLYGSKNTTPDAEKLVKLHEMVTKRCTDLSWSHCSLAAVASNPKLLSQLSELILQNQNWWGAEIGIETGSPEIAKKIMPAKAHPFSADNWHDVVVQGMGVAHDNMLVPACTIIVGLPDETESDILKTMDLVDDLKDMRSLIVPLFFVPLGHLTSEDWFTRTKLNELHRKLLIQCAERDFRWVDSLIDISFFRQMVPTHNQRILQRLLRNCKTQSPPDRMRRQIVHVCSHLMGYLSVFGVEIFCLRFRLLFWFGAWIGCNWSLKNLETSKSI